ncbi:MAG TPA: hypothetical protein VIV40_25385 [Kofleriaceae bacterium]
MIDEYVSDALAVTGTRRAPRATQHTRAHEPEPEAADLEPQTEPFGASYEDYESYEASAGPGTFVIDERNADVALLTQVTQQLAFSESAIETLPRGRAPRSTADLDDEITTIVKRPGAKPL